MRYSRHPTRCSFMHRIAVLVERGTPQGFDGLSPTSDSCRAR